MFLVTLNIGAVVGAIIGGQLADKFGSRKVLVAFLIIAFAALTHILKLVGGVPKVSDH
ncbi:MULTISPECIES: hypothetical protein [Bacillaceae]|uniref:hypothetical protein n=1 Tax=Bacillaceae TaxID=186817 RepID=UPI00035DD1E5|nr:MULTISPECIES: hypothetical protein [Bacillaceae]